MTATATESTAGRHEARPGPDERLARGRAVRDVLSLEALADVARDPSRADPVALLEQQSADRVEDLVPIRYGRMSVSPFTFYRGAARVMASDLAASPHTGLTVQLCGDAHLSNFGFFASPERRLVFDINDFDETLPGPFEWDVKRLVASLLVAARDNGYTAKQGRTIARATAARYRVAMAEFAGMRDLDVWYSHLDSDLMLGRVTPLLEPKRAKTLAKVLNKARSRDSAQAAAKLTTVVDGRLRIASSPPLVVPVRDLYPGADDEAAVREGFEKLIRQYLRTLQADRRTLVERYGFVDMARKVVGVGSVGTRCWIVLMTGRDVDDPLFLQVKEAAPSVLSEFLGNSGYASQGQRVVSGQRLMQATSDIFLGWLRVLSPVDAAERDFYVRQLRDWKASLPIESMLPRGMEIYGEVCAWSLARAHARSGDRIAIAGYLGADDTFDRAMTAFAEAYADVTERDYAAFTDAIDRDRIHALRGL